MLSVVLFNSICGLDNPAVVSSKSFNINPKLNLGW